MDWIFGLAMVLGIGPALALMYLVVRNYTYPRVEQPFFSDPTFFGLLVVGMIAGAALYAVMVMFRLGSNIVFMIILMALAVMVMVVVMNLKRFRGKSDSVFYGYALGLGMSCGLASGICFAVASTLTAAEATFDPSVVMLVVISITMSLILGSAGTTVGEGIARHRVMEFGLQAMMPMIIYGILLFVLVQGGEFGGVFAYYACAVVAVLFSAFVFYRTMYQRLPQIIREVLKMEGRKRSDIPK